MEYNEVLEHFKKDIQNNPDIEIIKFKHGVMTFYWTRWNTHTITAANLYKLPKNYMRY